MTKNGKQNLENIEGGVDRECVRLLALFDAVQTPADFAAASAQYLAFGQAIYRATLVMNAMVLRVSKIGLEVASTLPSMVATPKGKTLCQ